MLRWIKKHRTVRKSKSNSKSNDCLVHDVQEDPYHVYDEIDDVTDYDAPPNDDIYSVAHAVEYTCGLIRKRATGRRPVLKEIVPNILPNLIQEAVTSRNPKHCPGDDRVKSVGAPTRVNTLGEISDDYDEPWYEFDISGMGELSKFLVTSISSKTGDSSIGNSENATCCKKRPLQVFGRNCFRKNIHSDIDCHEESLAPCLPVRNKTFEISHFTDHRTLELSAPVVKRSVSLSHPGRKGTSSTMLNSKRSRNTSRDSSRRSSISSVSSGYEECLSTGSCSSDVTEFKNQQTLFRDSISSKVASAKRQPSIFNEFVSCEVTKPKSQPCLSNISISSDVPNVKRQQLLSSDITSTEESHFELHPTLSSDFISTEIGRTKRKPYLSGYNPNNRVSQITKQQQLLSRRNSNASQISAITPAVIEDYIYPVRQGIPTVTGDSQMLSGSNMTQGRQLRYVRTSSASSSTVRGSAANVSCPNAFKSSKGKRGSTVRPPMWANSKNRLLTDLITSNYDSQMFAGLR